MAGSCRALLHARGRRRSSTARSARRRDVGIVGGDHQREAELVAQRLDQVEHALPGVRVEVAGRLVAQQQLGLLGERPGDRDPLRLAAGELRRKGRPSPARPTRARSPPAPRVPVPLRRAGGPGRDARRSGSRRRRSPTRRGWGAGSSPGRRRRCPRPDARREPPRRGRRAPPRARSRSRRSAATRPPRTCRSVVLPDPERPSSATCSPSRDLEVDAASARTAASPAAVDDRDAAAGDQQPWRTAVRRPSLHPPVRDLDDPIAGRRRRGRSA